MLREAIDDIFGTCARRREEVDTGNPELDALVKGAVPSGGAYPSYMFRLNDLRHAVETDFQGSASELIEAVEKIIEAGIHTANHLLWAIGKADMPDDLRAMNVIVFTDKPFVN